MQARKNTVPQYKIADVLDLSTEPEHSHELSIIIDSSTEDVDRYTDNFRSDFFTILLTTEGEFTLSINLKEYLIKKSSLIITSPSDLKATRLNAKNSTLSGVIFTANFVTRAGMAKNAPDTFKYFSAQKSPVWELDDTDAALVNHCILQLSERSRNLKSHSYGTELLYIAFSTFLYEVSNLSKKYAQLQNTRFSRKENLVIDFVNLMQQQFKSNRSLKQFASQMNVTPEYLTETVKEITGKTAGEIIDDFVIQEAKMMLDIPHLSIAEIADELHFSDQSFFGKFFKRHEGLSPKEYRRRLS